MTKDIFFKEDAKEKLLLGINAVADAVKSTLGAAGRNVVIQNQLGLPANTKDGVTVARAIHLKDEALQQGAIMVKTGAEKSVEEAGDGTTQTSIFVQAMCNLGKEAIKEVNPIIVKRGIEEAVKIACDQIASLARPVETKDDLISIATISANNDPYLGAIIGEAFDKVGRDGEVVYEVNPSSSTTTLEIVDGMKINSGLYHPRLANNPAKMVYEAKDCLVLVSDFSIKSIREVENIVGCVDNYARQMQLETRPPIVFFSVVEGDAFAMIVNNVAQGNLDACIVAPSEFGALRKQILEDIAAYSGAHYHSEDSGDRITKDLLRLGMVSNIRVGSKTTVITGGNGDANAQVEKLKLQISESENSDVEADNLKRRIARLSGKVGVIRVGGKTVTEVTERIDRVDDSIHATRAAFQEGYVAGCGTTYLFASDQIYREISKESLLYTGASIVAEALKEPFIQNLHNGGIDNFQDYYPENYGDGVNMINCRKCNLIESKIIDPAKVLRVALQNAASVATLFIITECLITREPEPQIKYQ